MEALLTTQSKEDAAIAAGVSRTTVDAYLADSAFRSEYDNRRSGMVEAACTALQSSLTEAVNTLTEIMREPGNAPQSRIQAARSVLEYGVKLMEITDLTRRIEALEAMQKEREMLCM